MRSAKAKMALGGTVLLLLVVFVADPNLASASPAGTTTANDSCDALAQTEWTAQEQWVWGRICRNRPADLSTAGIFGPPATPTDARSWSPERLLRAGFLESVLFDDPYVTTLSNRPVRIAAARFDEPLEFRNASLPGPLFIEDSRFEKSVDLGGTRVPSAGFDRSVFLEDLNLNSARIGGPLGLREATLTSVNLTGATIDGNLELDGSTSTGDLAFHGGSVNGSVFLRGAQLRSVDLVRSEVSGNIESRGAEVAGDFNLNTAKVGGSLYLRDTRFGTFRLGVGEVAGVVEFHGSRFSSEAVFSGTKFASSFFLIDATLPALVMDGVNVEGTVALTGSALGHVSLRNSMIGQDLRLAREGAAQPLWLDDALLDLRSTSAGAVDDSSTAWPKAVRLAGFTYEKPRGSTSQEGDDLASRSTDWYLTWLRSEAASRLSGQPFLHLETMLRETGRRDVANKIAIERRKLELPQLSLLREALGWIHLATVGFGYQPERAILWILGLLAVGFIVVDRDRDFRQRFGLRSRLLFSIDQIIPLVKFSNSNADADLRDMVPSARRTFYVLKALGYVLGAFLVTAIAKVTTV